MLKWLIPSKSTVIFFVIYFLIVYRSTNMVDDLSQIVANEDNLEFIEDKILKSGCFVRDATRIFFQLEQRGEVYLIVPNLIGWSCGSKRYKKAKIFKGVVVKKGIGPDRIVDWDFNGQKVITSSKLIEAEYGQHRSVTNFMLGTFIVIKLLLLWLLPIRRANQEKQALENAKQNIKSRNQKR